MSREPATIAASSIIGPDWREGASVRRLPNERLMLARRGPPRIVLGVFPDWQALALCRVRGGPRRGVPVTRRRPAALWAEMPSETWYNSHIWKKRARRRSGYPTGEFS
jgi:hypothetical protein